MRSFTIFISIYHLGIGDFKSPHYYTAGSQISKHGNAMLGQLPHAPLQH
jgi:hypothetical protein